MRFLYFVTSRSSSSGVTPRYNVHMRSAFPSPGAAPPDHLDALANFTERRRQRFVATFPSQCDAILLLIDKADHGDTRGPVLKLRLLAHRIIALARLIGFTHVAETATALEQVISTGNKSGFEAALAKELVVELREALAVDLASQLPVVTLAPGEMDIYPPQTLHILIVDDHAMLRGGLRALLQSGFDSVAFGEAQDGAQALDVLRADTWDIVVLDVSLPGRNGLDLLKEIKAERPRLPVLVLTGHREDELAVRSLKAGASGYLTKESAPDELVRAVRKILNGGRYVTEAVAEQLAGEAGHDVQQRPHDALSDREYDVMCRLASGKTVTEIANEMSLSVKTISTYRTRILQKMRLRNNAAIVQYAHRNHLVC